MTMGVSEIPGVTCVSRHRFRGGRVTMRGGEGSAGSGGDGLGHASTCWRHCRLRECTSASILSTVGHHRGRLRRRQICQKVNILVWRGIPRLQRLRCPLPIRVHSMIHATITVGDEIDGDLRSNPRQVVNISHKLMEPIGTCFGALGWRRLMYHALVVRRWKGFDRNGVRLAILGLVIESSVSIERGLWTRGCGRTVWRRMSRMVGRGVIRVTARVMIRLVSGMVIRVMRGMMRRVVRGMVGRVTR